MYLWSNRIQEATLTNGDYNITFCLTLIMCIVCFSLVLRMCTKKVWPFPSPILTTLVKMRYRNLRTILTIFEKTYTLGHVTFKLSLYLLHYPPLHGSVALKSKSPSVQTVTEASPGQSYCSHYDATNGGHWGDRV